VQTYGAVSAYFSLYDAPFLNKSGTCIDTINHIINNSINILQFNELYGFDLLSVTGVYRTEQSKFVRHEYAKLIGRDAENGVDFWLLLNSWGYEWGRMDCSKPRGAQMRANLVVILLQVYLKFNNIFL